MNIMKKKAIAFGFLGLGLAVSSCARQVIAQNSQSGTQIQPLTIPTQLPAPDPKDITREMPPLNRDPQGFLPPANPEADIGEVNAVNRALATVASRYAESSPKFIQSRVMDYKQALQLGPDPIPVAEDDPLVSTPVRVVEMSGTFSVRGRPGQQGSTPMLSFTKALIILRAADGLELGSVIFNG